MATSTLHHAFVRPEAGTPDRAALFLHGILGTGMNLRPVAQAFVKADPRYEAVLVDLRQHGRSQGFPAPHTIAACAADLAALEHSLALPVKAAVGHSFGGKVALAYLSSHPALERVVSLDSGPGARPDREGSADTDVVLATLARAPARFAKRDDFVEFVKSEGHSRMVADWLAMNLERDADGFRLRTDLASIHALLDDYFTVDLWPALEQSSAAIDVVIGDRSGVWSEAERTRLRALEASSAGRVRAHVIPDAGHWVHVEAPAAVASVVSPR